MSPEGPEGPEVMEPGREPSADIPVPQTGPVGRPPRWSGRKTAIAAALAIGFATAGTAAAAAAMPSGSGNIEVGRGPGGSRQMGSSIPGQSRRNDQHRQRGQNGQNGGGSGRTGRGWQGRQGSADDQVPPAPQGGRVPQVT